MLVWTTQRDPVKMGGGRERGERKRRGKGKENAERKTQERTRPFYQLPSQFLWRPLVASLNLGYSFLKISCITASPEEALFLFCPVDFVH